MMNFEDVDIGTIKQVIDPHQTQLKQRYYSIFFEGERLLVDDVTFYSESHCRRVFTTQYCDVMLKKLMLKYTTQDWTKFDRKTQLKFWKDFVKFLESKGVLEFKKG